jgi:hypothetical protein
MSIDESNLEFRRWNKSLISESSPKTIITRVFLPRSTSYTHRRWHPRKETTRTEGGEAEEGAGKDGRRALPSRVLSKQTQRESSRRQLLLRSSARTRVLPLLRQRVAQRCALSVLSQCGSGPSERARIGLATYAQYASGPSTRRESARSARCVPFLCSGEAILTPRHGLRRALPFFF